MKHFYIILKATFLCLLTLALSNSLNAQVEKIGINTSVSSTVEIPGNFSTSPPNLSILPPLWNVQLSVDVSAAVGSNANAGVVWVGTEFWISQWNSDTIWRLDSVGNYLGFTIIPTVAGTRGMTYDGTSVYMGGATGNIAVVNPLTFTVTSNIILPAGISARQISYDATANAGAGGLWVANVFGGGANTNIFLVDLNGTILLTIPQSTHTLSGIYGFAVDNISNCGPFLWVFSQPGSIITQLELPSGVPTGTTFDVNADIGSTTGIAGGIFIDTTIIAGEYLLGCVVQQSPDILTVYDLRPDDFDASTENLSASTTGYTQTPVSQVSPLTFTGSTSNKGAMSLNNVKLNLDVKLGATTVFADSTVFPTFGCLTPYSYGPYTPTSVGTYDVTATVTTDVSQPDAVATNNVETLSFSINDSTMARDDGIHNGGTGYGVSAVNSGYALVLYDLPNADTLTSVTIELATPITGDTTFAVVVNASGGFPGTITDIGRVQVISGAQNVYTLKFPYGGVVLSAGTWGIGVYEGANTTINLRQSANIYTPSTNYFQVSTAPGLWTASGIATARFIRPNFGIAPVNVGLTELENIENRISMYPNPSTGTTELYFNLENAMEMGIKVYDNMGKIILSDKLENILQLKYVIDLSKQSNGLYFIEMDTNHGNIVKKLMLNK